MQIYEVGEQDGIHYIAQEYVAGRNLGELIRGSGSLSPQLTLDILRQAAAALAKAASENIVHRDIKPENIMLGGGSGEVKVADFGLARVQGDDGAKPTQIGITMGTPPDRRARSKSKAVRSIPAATSTPSASPPITCSPATRLLQATRHYPLRCSTLMPLPRGSMPAAPACRPGSVKPSTA